jgi:plasmid stabilization system protein ParE
LKIVLLPQAQRDLDTIFEPVLTRVVRRLRLLERFPGFGAALVGPLRGYRSTPVDMFRIVYRVVRNKTIEIAYIRHCKRAPAA